MFQILSYVNQIQEQQQKRIDSSVKVGFRAIKVSLAVVLKQLCIQCSSLVRTSEFLLS